MTDYVAGKVIIVTGAGSGFGRLVSQKAGERGAKLVCADIDDAALEETVSGIHASGGEAEAHRTDVTDLEEMQALAVAAVERFGAIDVMINNAGIMPLAFFADHRDAAEAWNRCIDVNIKGVLYGIMSVYDQMTAQGHGHVINLSSIFSNAPVVGAGVYGATKVAVNFLSESLRVETQGRIKVTIVKPTGVPATNLAAGVINPQAGVGIVGHNRVAYVQRMEALAAGDLPADEADPEQIGYFALAPEHLAEQILYAIDQPWGVSIGDITVRASGENFLL